MTDFIVVVILAVILTAAVRYVYKAKRSGAKCIGCPMGAACSRCGGGPSAGCGCGGHPDTK